MRDSTVLAVLLLVTLGTATDELKLNYKRNKVTCSSVTISWTSEDNRTADFRILYNSTVHSGDKNHKKDASPPHTTKLTNLVADTEYTITVMAEYDNDGMTVSDTITVKTEAGAPSQTEISTTFIGSTSLSFKVNDTGNKPYDCWINGTDHRLHRWTQNRNTTVAGLNPGTYYKITCQKRNQACQITHTVVTNRAGTPTGVTVQAQSCHTLNVTWSPPDQTGGLPITGYNISYNDASTSKYEHSSTTMKSLQQLKPDTKYIVRVKAMNAIGGGDFTQEHSWSTNQIRAGNVSATANSAHSIHLSHNLSKPGVYYLCNMTAVVSGVKKETNKNVTTKVTNVTGLRPDTTYRVDCVAYHSDGVEYCLEANTTVTTRPDRVLNVTVRGSTVHSVHRNDSITVIQNITWEAPPNHHSIRHYVVKYQMQVQATSSKSMRTSNNATQATLVLLVPQGKTSTYSVWVAAVSETGQGEFSDRVDFNYSRPDAPTQVQSANHTCNSINITWSTPKYTGGVPLENYTVRWSGRGSPLMTVRPDVTAVTVTRLLPNASYTINVTSVNAIGEGERSEQVMVTTISQDMSLMVSVSTISSTSLHITAQPPPDVEVEEVNCTLAAKENSSYIHTVSLNSTRDKRAIQRLVDSLVPYTNYSATCLVFKDGVDQCYTGNDTTRTYTDIPSGPPEGVATVSTSSHSFTMSWDPPPKEHQNGGIVSYEVEYREEDSNSTVVNATTRGMRYTAEDLTTDRVYQFRVAATTVNGTGPFSEWSLVITIPTVTNLRAVNTTTNSTTITWDQPPHNYTVFLHGEATDNIPQSRVIHLVDVTGQTTHNIGGLDSFRNYSIGVYLESDLGQGSNATVTFQTQGRGGSAVAYSPCHYALVHVLVIYVCYKVQYREWSTSLYV